MGEDHDGIHATRHHEPAHTTHLREPSRIVIFSPERHAPHLPLTFRFKPRGRPSRPPALIPVPDDRPTPAVAFLFELEDAFLSGSHKKAGLIEAQPGKLGDGSLR